MRARVGGRGAPSGPVRARATTPAMKASAMATGNRPLSPHIQIYRWQWTMTLSILHRITGVALALGTLLLVWWLVAAASDPAYFALVQDYVGHWLGRLLLFGWSFALFYHLVNGIRHLLWDAGWGLELPTAHATGIAAFAAAVVLTLLAWLIGYGVLGG